MTNLQSKFLEFASELEDPMFVLPYMWEWVQDISSVPEKDRVSYDDLPE